jgi:hypothetical protein
MKQEHMQLEESKPHQFDAFCKKVLKLTARDQYKATKLRQEHEVPLSELSDFGLTEPTMTDEYFKDEYHFSVLEYDIGVTDVDLAAISAYCI